MSTNDENSTSVQHDAKLPVSGWRWFDAVLKFKNGKVCEYVSCTNGNLEDAKKQAGNAILGEVAEVLSIAFR